MSKALPRKGSFTSFVNGMRRTLRKSNSLQVKTDMQAFEREYKITRAVLGAGKFGVVKVAKRPAKQDTVAVKLMEIEGKSKREVKALYKEVYVLQQLEHQHIVSLLDVYKTNSILYIVMEKAEGGDLLHELIRKDEVIENDIRNISYRLFDALNFLKSKNVVHRDLKPDNILLGTPGDLNSVMLADFGFASQTLAEESNSLKLLETTCGSPAYIAPEVKDKNVPKYNYKCDTWSMGTIVYVMLCGYLPFGVHLAQMSPEVAKAANPKALQHEQLISSQQELMAAIDNYAQGIWDFVPEKAWENISVDAKTLLRDILVADPDERPDYEAIFASDWFKDFELVPTGYDGVIDVTPHKELSAKIKAVKIMQVKLANLRIQELMMTPEELEALKIESSYAHPVTEEEQEALNLAVLSDSLLEVDAIMQREDENV